LGRFFDRIQHMVITWHGEGCFKCQSGEISILSDPSTLRFKPNIVLRTLVKVPPEEEGGEILVVNTPGEYDAFGVNIKGFQLKKESTESFIKTIYLVDFEGVRFCFLGHISEMLEATEMEGLEAIDVLFVPGGGKPFVSQGEAVKLINQLAPKIVIPSFFKDTREFMKEFGKQAEPLDKFTFKKKDLSEKGTELVILKI